MNKKGDFNTAFWTIIIVIFMVPFWAFVIGPQLAYWGHATAIQTSGLEALFYDNLNLVFFTAMVVFVVIGGKMSGEI